MYYNSRNITLPLSLFSYRWQLQCQDSRGWVVPTSAAGSDVTSRNSLSAHTCVPENLFTSLFVLFIHIMIKCIVLCWALWMHVAIRSLALTFILVESITKQIIWIYFNSISCLTYWWLESDNRSSINVRIFT